MSLRTRAYTRTDTHTRTFPRHLEVGGSESLSAQLLQVDVLHQKSEACLVQGVWWCVGVCVCLGGAGGGGGSSCLRRLFFSFEDVFLPFLQATGAETEQDDV